LFALPVSPCRKNATALQAVNRKLALFSAAAIFKGKENPMSRRPHDPTPSLRQLVQLHATIGTRHDTIARIVGIDAKTLRKYYREELDLAEAQANATIGGALFNKAKSGDTAAMIFWMKTRAGWRETNHTLHGNDPENPMPQGVPDELVTALNAIAGKIAGGDSAG
jgi:hypothetical protein